MFKIGIIGCGKVAQVRHIPEYMANPDAEIVAREILMTGHRVGAEEALRIGLASRVCHDGEERAEAIKLADIFAALPRGGIAETKRAFNATLIEEAAKILGPAD